MALERLQSVFNNIDQNEARSTDDMPSPSIDEIGDDHFYSSGFFDSINQILQPDGTYQPYGTIPIGAAAENSPMSRKLILSEAEPSTTYYSGYENQFGVRIRDVQGVYTAHQGMNPNAVERAISQFDDQADRLSEIQGFTNPQIRFTHINGANVGRNNVLGTGKYVLEEVYDPTHGNVYADRNFFLRSNAGSRRNLDIKGYGDTFRSAGLGLGAFDNTDFGKLNEPYIIHNIPEGKTNRKNGYNRNTIPWRASLEDQSRLAMFYTSPAGITSLAAENVTNVLIGDGFQPIEPFASILAPPIPVPNTGFLNFYQQTLQELSLVPGGSSARKPFKSDYSFKSNLGLPFGNLGDNLLPLPVPKLPDGFLENKLLPNIVKKKLIDTAEGLLEKIANQSVPNVGRPTPFMDLTGGPKRTEYDDKINKSGAIAGYVLHAEDNKLAPGDLLGNGKGDFYVRFKDLRHDVGRTLAHGVFLYFRGFVTGINENVTPSYSPTQYIGRSEDVYTYQKAERDFSFNLKVYPNNKKEFDTMYKKLNYLTGMVYPMYADDGGGLARMKPPFTELYMAHIGSRAQGQFGFIKSLTYTVPEAGDWDSQTSLPRLFDIAISYQILNKRPPSFRTPFYRGQNSIGETS